MDQGFEVFRLPTPQLAKLDEGRYGIFREVVFALEDLDHVARIQTHLLRNIPVGKSGIDSFLGVVMHFKISPVV